MTWSRARRGLVAGVVLVAIGWAPATAASGADPVRVTGTAPGGCVADRTGEVFLDSEVEPHLAINPTNPEMLLTAFQQHRFRANGGAAANGVALSVDAGATWQRVEVPGLTCGQYYDRLSDPWVSYGPDGAAYLSSLTISEAPGHTIQEGTRAEVTALVQDSVIVNVSRNGGASDWSEPIVVAAENPFNDRPTVAANPYSPGTAYVTWTEKIPFTYEATGSIGFAALDDYGKKLQVSRIPFKGPPGEYPIGNEVIVNPDGSLVIVFLVRNHTDRLAMPPNALLPKPHTIMAIRSTDGGATWSDPTLLGQAQRRNAAAVDGKTFNAPVVATAEAADGHVYVAWLDVMPDGRSSRVLFTSSTDFGVTWQPPIEALPHMQTMRLLPTLTAQTGGQLGLLYFGFEDDAAGDGAVTTNVNVVASGDHGQSWTEPRTLQTFDFAHSPLKSGGLFLADYLGFVPTPNGFAAMYPVAQPESAGTGKSDLYFARLTTAAAPNNPPELALNVTPGEVVGNGPVTISASVVDADGAEDVTSAEVTVTDANGRQMRVWSRGDFASDGATRLTLVGDVKLSGHAPFTVTLSASDVTGPAQQVTTQVERSREGESQKEPGR